MLILDIDNTILPSKEAYDFSLKCLSEFWQRKAYGSALDFYDRFKLAREEIKVNLEGHSSNRLRILYFKRMIELKFGSLTKKRINLVLKMEEIYFKNFSKYLKEFFHLNKGNYKFTFKLLNEIQASHKIIFLSNENLRTQLIKLESVFPKNFHFNLLVSEELGIEKPSAQIFIEACRRIDSNPEQCVMIGDNHIDDIEGASKLGITTIHLKEMFGEREITKNLNISVSNSFVAHNLNSSLEYYISMRPV